MLLRRRVKCAYCKFPKIIIFLHHGTQPAVPDLSLSQPLEVESQFFLTASMPGSSAAFLAAASTSSTVPYAQETNIEKLSSYRFCCMMNSQAPSRATFRHA